MFLVERWADPLSTEAIETCRMFAIDDDNDDDDDRYHDGVLIRPRYSAKTR